MIKTIFKVARRPGGALCMAALLCGMSGPAPASVLSLTGLFGHDDDIVTETFTLAAAGTVTIRTWSFGGGTNGAGSLISPGGFAPVIALFDAGGAQDLIGLANAGAAGSCGPGANTDPASGFCWDVYISSSLAAGSYIVTLTEDDNLPNGPGLADGFHEDGQGDFTGPTFTPQPGSCIMVGGSQRSCAWALDIALPDSTPTAPEPATAALVALGLAGLVGFRRRVRRNPR